MMYRFLLATATVAASLMGPLTAHAYVTPEQALDDDSNSVNFYSPPPSKRQIQEATKAAQEENVRRRLAEQEAMAAAAQGSSVSSAASSAHSSEDLHGAAPEEPTVDDPMTTEELRDARLLERIKAEQERDELAAQMRALGLDETLHSGAPLSDTGPGTVVAVLAIAAAVLWTVRTVMREERREF